ncbi:MAG: hypothetical protein M0P71_06155 [Melioribacteraceae bacterium]|nr:hypothetical protein [Melioribacteraceae bacterium]
MLINLSNHPSSMWHPDQLNLAIELYGDVKDISFPQIDPHSDSDSVYNLAKEYLDRIITKFKQTEKENNAVHLMGELTFSYSLTNLLKKEDIQIIASTTSRDVKIDENGNKVSIFKFVRFRNYK